MGVEIKASATFAENLFYEKLIEMRSTSRKAFDSMSPVSKLALAEYEKQKREAAITEEARLGMACHRRG